MRRVIIESPFAPQTPLFEGEHEGGGSHKMCRKCLNEERREWESACNARYLDACLLDSLRRGEAPFASHGLYTRPGVLDDLKPEERRLGISAGFVWRAVAQATVIYTDLGWSEDMRAGERDAKRLRALIIEQQFHPIEYRTLGPDWDKKGSAK
jgi:hypothetical protein